MFLDINLCHYLVEIGKIDENTNNCKKQILNLIDIYI